jgi:preprotein translocase subunit SecY
MLGTFANIFKVPDLRNKILFTIALLCIYRVGFFISVPGFNAEQIQKVTDDRDTDSPLGRAADYMQMFTGGTLQRSSLFGLGIMPYISASIILMLLGEVLPALKKLRQEGQTGHKKIQEYTRYLTVPLCLVQSLMYMKMFASGEGYVYPGMQVQAIVMGVVGMTAGTLFLMWLGEQIDEYGMGNGISLIIMAGILSRMPWAIMQVLQNAQFKVGVEAGKFGPGTIVFLIAAFVFVIDSDPAGQANARPSDVWRSSTLFAVACESWWCDADYLCFQFDDVSADRFTAVGKNTGPDEFDCAESVF